MSEEFTAAPEVIPGRIEGFITKVEEDFTAAPEEIPEKIVGLLSRRQFYLALQFQAMILILVATVGFITNIINIKTFISMGAFNDGVTSTFLCLAVSDFMLCCSAIGLSSSRILISREARWLPQLHLGETSTGIEQGFLSKLDPAFLGIVAVAVMQMFSLMTISITVYLAVARCLCVVKPLRFRNSITVKKTLIFVTTVFALSFASRLPNLAHVRILMKFDNRFNSSRLTLKLLPEREMIKDATWLSVDITSCIGAQIILVVCIGIMLKGLRAAAEFRSTASTNEHRSTKSVAKETASSAGAGNSDKIGGKIDTKEARIAKQMVFVSTIFVVCNIPKMFSYLTTNIEPEFDLGGKYQFLYIYSITVLAMFDALNSSVNIFVYLKFNSKFRKTFLRTN